MRPVTRGLVGLAVFLLIWEVVGRSGITERRFLPPPSDVLGSLGEILVDGKFQSDVVATVLALVVSVAIAVLIAVPLGLLLGSFPVARHATRAVVEFLRPIPSVAFIPLAVVMLGVGPETKITLAVYAAVWPILFNTIYALDEVEDLHLETARAFGYSRVRTILSISLPSAVPFVLTGVRLASSIGLVVLISTEMIAGGRLGIGTFINVAREGAGRMDLLLAATVVAGAIGYLVNAAFDVAQRRWVSWSSLTRSAS
ncbi:NitT/TauT family transport system permease protein [Herbihabitans rhizosphaerae]|uniref:NitT/TauT family transport system permease protein n=1 Tax=Herbihabitans rhizosphaerae TaxID=1872711 RepID=A0A4Q7KXK2_9PSEU|nr:ABC transporter permease [Herbihabitans rhizosphaerae]RZS41050.1 NitT/TauT family transport system permease protein [Herbihabitans rhizosphaerae]